MPDLGGMPLLNDYSLCRDTVTVYHEEGGEVTRTVFPRAYLETDVSGGVDKTGGSGASGFLLVVPGDAQACEAGDKVFDGEGPEVPESDILAWWRTFIPAKVDGLVVVRKAGVRRWGGEVVHTEASG